MLGTLDRRPLARTQMAKFVLCRPQGGLNDVLNQIEACIRYSERFDRILVVETDYKNSGAINRPFCDYFTSKQDNLILNSAPFIDSFDTMEVFPSFLRGKLYSYTAYYDMSKNRDCETESRLPITFDFSRDYEEDLLVHHQVGGGEESQFCLMRMRLHDSLGQELVDRLRCIGTPYCAIHIRHTDITTNYLDALSEIRNLQIDKLFVATDNRGVLDDFKAELGADHVVSFTMLPNETGKPIHYGWQPTLDPDRRNREAILDLLTLASASVLFLCKTNNNYYSGYSLLAKNLFNNKESLKSLLNSRLDDLLPEQGRSFLFMM